MPAARNGHHPAEGGYGDTNRKYSDDFGRKQLSDLVEADEELDHFMISHGLRSASNGRKASTSSTYSVSSLDGIWERHPRRLSEAGLRRSSEHSIVLTEDTDSFIIGEHVWVGGSKPGQIAYIGETQFAPGDWAGIVLDEAIGKNDGSVAGIRYFQCAQRRGVFSRLTRLTRFPLTPPTPSPSSPTPTTPGSVTSSARRTVSPARSVRSVASSRMNASISTTIGGSVDKGGELRLGERVIISSSQGSKAGTLRYWGTVEFTSGIWAGVELDDPIGKNDGSVEGKRYFECSPRFGLFAPASKVSRSPSRRRPGACAIHSPAAPRRSTSRESLSSQGTSLATSLASSRLPTSHARLSTQRGPRVTSTPMSAKNTLQELLREKQQHLEQLMKERELERAEVAKYTLQADRAESALSIARKECAKFLTDNEKLKYDLEAISRQLDDEKQKVDDLLFRAEEDNISKDDYSKYKEKMDNELSLTIQKVSEMDAARALAAAAESAVREQLQRMQLEADTQYQQQTAELQAAQVLSSELQKLLDEAYALLREKENEKDAISKSLNEEINKVKQDTDKHLTESKSKLAVAKTEFDGQVAVLSAKLQAAEAKLTAQTQGLERAKEDSSSALTELMVKLEQTQASLDDKTQELNKVVVASKEQEVFLKKEINKSKMELSSKMIDFETLTENIKKLETNLNSAQEESYSLKDQHGKKISELEGLINDMSQNNETLSLTNKELQHGLQQKQSEMDKVQHDFSVFRELNDRMVEDFKKTIQEKSDEVNVLQHKLNELKSSFENSNESLNNEYKKQIDDKDSTISSLTHQIVELKLSVNQSREDFSNVTANVNTNINEIKKLTEENQQLKHKVLELNEVNTSYTSKISGMELEIGDLKRNLQSITERNEDLLNSKEKLEHDIKSKSTNENEHLNKTIIELQSRDKELAELKDQTRERNNQHERTKQELNQQIQKIQADHLKVVQELSNGLKESCSLMDAENQKMVALRNEFQAVRDEHQKTIVNISVQYEKEKEKLIQELDKRKEIESVLNGQLKLLEENSNRLISDLNSSIDELKSSGETSEIKLKEKLDQLVEAQNDLNIKLELARKNEQSLQESLNSSIAKFNEEKSHLESKLKDAENQTVSLGDEITNVKSKLEGASNLLLDKENTIKTLTLQYSMLEVDLKANGDMLIEKDKQIESINDELKKLKDEKHTLEKALKVTEKETNDLHQRLELLTQDNAGNDSLIQDQQRLFEKVQKQLESATTEKHQVEIICNELSQKLELSKQCEESLNKQVKEFQLISLESEGRFKQLEETLKSYKVDSEKLKQNLVLEEKIKEEILKIKSELVDKNMLIANLNIELETSKSSSASSQNELNEKCKKLESESYTFKEKYMKEADTLQKTIREQDKLLKESQPSVDELKVANIKIEELQNLILKSEEDIKQLNAISSGQKKNYDDISAQLRSDNEKVKKESKKERNALKAQLEEIEKISTTTKTQLDTEIKKRVDLQTRLDESESTAKELQNKVEWLTIHQEKNSSEQQVLLEKLTIELQNSRKKYDEHMKSDANKIDTLNQELLKNMSELDKQKDFANSLQKDLKHYKAKTEIAEREKVLLQKELSKLQITEIKSVKIPVINNNVAVNNLDIEAQKLLEEKQMVEGQVDFLNSVIVDMQRKNEQLLARVHALETGFSAQEADEFNYNGTKSSRVPAPRLFCDICDVWDAHDTEDCPRQAGDEDSGRSSTPPPRDPANKRPPPAPRPYCDVCEVFGHATEDCNEEETF